MMKEGQVFSIEVDSRNLIREKAWLEYEVVHVRLSISLVQVSDSLYYTG